MAVVLLLAGCGGSAEGPPFKKFVKAQLDHHRNAVHELIAEVEKGPDPREALAWRPGEDRAQIGWQLMHIAASDDAFVHGQLYKKESLSKEYVETYTGDRRPPDELPSLDEIKRYLKESRAALHKAIDDMDLKGLKEKAHEDAWGTRFEGIQYYLFHEAHHHGQAKLTHNLYKVRKGLAKKRK